MHDACAAPGCLHAVLICVPDVYMCVCDLINFRLEEDSVKTTLLCVIGLLSLFL